MGTALDKYADMKPTWDHPVVIESHINGVRSAHDDTGILRRAIELGGHIKTGLELFYDPDRNPTNLDLLQQAREIAQDVGRPIATHEEARALYNIT